MTTATIEQRLRLFLLSVAALLCVGTVIELWLTEHTKELIQLLPFGLCALGLGVISAVLVRPQPATIWGLRVAMAVVGSSSLIGVYEHIQSNMEVVLEVKANAPVIEQIWYAAHGAAPLLAPGILALVAALSIAATYYHPALGNRKD
jgi:prepilin signal peptidase PulO-like enzyme (type II secretory pathway)